MIVDRILAHSTEKAGKREQSKAIGAYNIGRCVAQNWFRVHGYEPEPMEGRAENVLALGNVIEDTVADQIAAAGIAGWRRPVKRCDHDWKLRDSCDQCKARERDVRTVLGDIRVIADGFFANDGREWPVEIKSMSNFAFERALRGELDEGYIAQATTYCKAYDVPYVPVVCYRKETSHLHEVIVKFDDDLWTDLAFGVQVAKGNVQPERPYKISGACQGCNGTGKTAAKALPHKACSGTGREPGGPFIPGFPCGYCSWKTACWGPLEMTVNDYGKPRWRLRTEATQAVAS